MTTPEQLAAALGVPLFSTDLYVPAYRAGDVGPWRITHEGFGLDRGYYSGHWAVHGMPVLLRSRGDPPVWESWMSLSPHELESQEFGCRRAFGYTVVMGLGLGWVAVNVALNPAVDRVTVVEIDPAVIDLFHRSGALDGLPQAALDKIEIVEADALQWRPSQPVDVLYADIWLRLAEPQVLDEVRRMQENVAAGSIYYWGQELTLYSCARQLAGADGRLDEPLLRRCVEEVIALPLLIPPGVDYVGLIERVAENRRARGLAV
jgi:hypothetical protein